MSSYDARHGPEIDGLIDKITNMIIAWNHILCETKNVANKNHPIDSYREQHDSNRKRFGEREDFLIIKQSISEIKQYNYLILISRTSALMHCQTWDAYDYELCETRSVDKERSLLITRNKK